MESVEFVGGFNERGGTEMRVAELSLAYRGAAQRRIRPEAERGWAGFVSCAMSLSWTKTISAGSPSTGKVLATSSAFPLSEHTRLRRNREIWINNIPLAL